MLRLKASDGEVRIEPCVFEEGWYTVAKSTDEPGWFRLEFDIDEYAIECIRTSDLMRLEIR